MLSKIIRNFIAKRVAGRTDDGIMITLKDPKKVEFQGRMLEDLLMRNGIDPNAIKSEQQLKNILNQIEAFEKKNLADNISSGIRNTESAKVFDLEGKEIPKGSKIMGGKAVDDDLPPPGSRGGKDDIAAPVQSQEETMKNMMEAEIKAKLEKQNKDSVQRILERKNREDVYGLDDYDTTNMSEIKKEIIRTETKLGNLNPDDSNFRAKAKPLIDKIEALKNKMRDDKADGGRIGLKGGADAATESFSKSAGSTRPGRKGSVNISPSGNVTFDPGGRDEGPDDRSTFEQTVNQRRIVNEAKKQKPSNLENMFRTGSELNYLRNLIKMNPQGLGLSYLTNKIGNFLFPPAGAAELSEDELNILRATNPKGYDDAIKEVLSDKTAAGGGITDVVPDLTDPKLAGSIAEAGGLTVTPKTIGGKEVFGVQVGGELMRVPTDLSQKAIEAIQQDKRVNELTKDQVIDKALDFDYGTTIDEEGAGNIYDKVSLPGQSRTMAAGGGIARIGLKDGMNRRTFLKIFSGLVSLPIIGKVLKPLKVGKKVTQVPIIKTGDVPGKPEWFDQLVNKVILEGDDVTKRFATQERQVIHKKKIDDETSVTVTQDLNDGSIMVDVDDPIRNVMGESGDDTSVMMMLKKNPGDESSPAGPDEFSFTEADMRNYMDGPDDYTTEFTENTVQKMSDLTSDLGKIKSYATNKKPTMKEFVESKKRKDMVRFAEKNPSEYAANRGPEFDPDYDDYASGGIAGMLGE